MNIMELRKIKLLIDKMLNCRYVLNNKHYRFLGNFLTFGVSEENHISEESKSYIKNKVEENFKYSIGTKIVDMILKSKDPIIILPSNILEESSRNEFDQETLKQTLIININQFEIKEEE